MTTSNTLKLDIEAYASHLRGSNRLFRRARSGDVHPRAVAAYVANLRLLVQHTDKNLTLAQKRAAELGNQELARFFAEKRHEEEGHERWAEDDMATLTGMFGVTPIAEPSRSITALLDYLREVIADEPVNYLAYILFSEYVTVLLGPEWLDLLEKRCGIPAVAVSVVANHVELDKDHVGDGLQEIDRLAGHTDAVEPMRVALRTSMNYFEGFCNEISDIVH